MVSDKEVLELLQEFNSIKPLAFLQRIDMQSMGIGNVLAFLVTSDHKVTAGEISDYMNVSTARVAVLLKKMADKKLIVKKADPKDARKVLVSITKEGREHLYEQQKEILLYGSAIVDHFGKERIEDFIESCREIREIVDAVETEVNANKDIQSKNT